MFFRFACAITLLTCISLVGIAVQKQNLALKRQISSQHYDIQELKEQRCRLVLETQRLATPTRLHEQQQANPAQRVKISVRRHPHTPKPPPLLNWQFQRRGE